MQFRVSTLLVIAFTLAPLSTVGAQSTADQPAASSAPATTTREPEVFKDWTMTCEQPAGSEHEQCYVFQNLILKKGRQRVLNVAIGRIAKDNQPAALFTFPLGISLPGGVGLKIDEGEPLRFAVERCQANGCVAPLRLDEKLLAALKSGDQARVAFRDAARREIVVPVSLRGFTAAFNALP